MRWWQWITRSSGLLRRRIPPAKKWIVHDKVLRAGRDYAAPQPRYEQK
jgi:hypothetical protein